MLSKTRCPIGSKKAVLNLLIKGGPAPQKCYARVWPGYRVTGCINLTFLRDAFSNVSSNGMHEMMHSHTGCIFLIFSLLCRFKRVFSILFFTVPRQMYSQAVCPRGCIVTLVAFVWLFSTVGFQMSPQIACLRGCKVTLVAFV